MSLRRQEKKYTYYMERQLCLHCLRVIIDFKERGCCHYCGCNKTVPVIGQYLTIEKYWWIFSVGYDDIGFVFDFDKNTHLNECQVKHIKKRMVELKEKKKG